MQQADWNSCFDSILSNLRHRVLKCEDLCEDLAEVATSMLRDAAPSAEIASPSMALALLHRYPVPLVKHLEVHHSQSFG